MEQPKYLEELKINDLPLKFKDLPARRLAIDSKFQDLYLKISPRGIIALGASMSEWVLWRLDGHHELDTKKLIEAMWSCVAHPSYLVPFDVETWPPVSDPIWKSPLTTAYYKVYFHFRKLIEEMMGYHNLQVIGQHCYNVLETGTFKSRKTKFESTTGREMEFTFYRWLHEITPKVLEISPIDDNTFHCMTTQRPDPSLQESVIWGAPVCREDIFGEGLNEGERIAEIDALLQRVKGNPFLCNADEVSDNKVWAPFKRDVPMLNGETYAFDKSQL